MRTSKKRKSGRYSSLKGGIFQSVSFFKNVQNYIWNQSQILQKSVLHPIKKVTLIYFLVLKPYLESKKDLTYGKYRDSYVISENRNLESFVNDDTNAVVVFWATWCSHCVEEAEDLNNFITSLNFSSIYNFSLEFSLYFFIKFP